MSQHTNGVPTPSTPLTPGSAAVAAEQVWSSAGERIAAGHYSQKLIEQKERELQEYIALHHARIRQVEGELSDVQLQLKLTAGPKKQALELMRRKIEAQNQRVVLARRRQEIAKQAFDAADAELQEEEAQKEQLCNELNILVQQSVQAQLDRFAELQSKLEMLSNGVAPLASTTKANGVVASTSAAAPAAVQGAPDSTAVGSASSTPGDEHQPGAADEAAQAAAEAEQAAQQRAQQMASRARHVQLQQTLGRGRTSSAASQQQQQQDLGGDRGKQTRQQGASGVAPLAVSVQAADGRFTGFDA